MCEHNPRTEEAEISGCLGSHHRPASLAWHVCSRPMRDSVPPKKVDVDNIPKGWQLMLPYCFHKHAHMFVHTHIINSSIMAIWAFWVELSEICHTHSRMARRLSPTAQISAIHPCLEQLCNQKYLQTRSNVSWGSNHSWIGADDDPKGT